MELYIGVNYYGHDSAIFIIDPQNKDVFAMSTERLSRFKHDTIFPNKVLKRYIEYKKIDPKIISKVHFSNARLEHMSFKLLSNTYEKNIFLRRLYQAEFLKEFISKDRIFNSKSPFQKFMYLLLKGEHRKYKNIINSNQTSYLSELINKYSSEIFPNAEINIKYFDHEECHAYSSYLTSPLTGNLLLITMDAQGDHNKFSSIFKVENQEVKHYCTSISPNKFFNFCGKYTRYNIECSIGGMYTYFTYKLGFTPNADEGKVEALAAFGKYKNEIYDKLWKCFELSDQNEIIIHQEEAELLFSLDEFDQFLTVYSKEDISAAIQKFLEEFMLSYIKKLIETTKISNLCLSGGIFANVILNLRIYNELTKNIYIVPAMTDEGTAEGAAYLSFIKSNTNRLETNWLKENTMPYFGTHYSKEQVLNVIEKYKGIKFSDESEHWPELAAKLVVEGKIGAIFHGRMEWGPRALGNRSIIADCRSPEVTKKINGSIKNRPLFQPFCPSILEEDRERLFENSYPNKHMTCAFIMKQEHREKIPASVHIDGTGRAQFVEEKDNPMYYRYLKELKRLTGYGVSINTSFNKHGRTIVESPEHAIRDFLDTNMDFVIIEGYIITRK